MVRRVAAIWVGAGTSGFGAGFDPGEGFACGGCAPLRCDDSVVGCVGGDIGFDVGAGLACVDCVLLC